MRKKQDDLTDTQDIAVLNKQLDLELNLTENLSYRRIKAYSKAIAHQQSLGLPISDPFSFVPVNADSVKANLQHFQTLVD